MRNAAVLGMLWAFGFVFLESVQFVYFGGLFQRVNSFLFGASVLGLTTASFIAVSAYRRPDQIRAALAQPGLLIKINVTASFAWIAFLGSVQLIEPAVAYTIGAGVMPLTAVILHKCGWPEGQALRNRMERIGNLLILSALILLCIFTICGFTGFEQGNALVSLLGIGLAIADGVLFTLLLAYCQRLDNWGVGPAAVFGLRFPLYVLSASVLAAITLTPETTPNAQEYLSMLILGVVLIVPPLYALQRAVALTTTLTLGAITATGPFIIFVLQILEGRVSQSGATFFGLCFYFLGALFAAFGAVMAEGQRK